MKDAYDISSSLVYNYNSYNTTDLPRRRASSKLKKKSYLLNKMLKFRECSETLVWALYNNTLKIPYKSGIHRTFAIAKTILAQLSFVFSFLKFCLKKKE